MLQILMPMAGKGSRFRDAGYTDAKPLIDVAGQHMFELVMANTSPDTPHRWILVARSEDAAANDLVGMANAAGHQDVTVVSQVGDRQGAVATCMLALPYLDLESPLMIVNSDQWVRFDANEFLSSLGDFDGSILTMTTDRDPKWSYVERNQSGDIVGVREKVAVSDEGTVGLYLFRRARDFVNASALMIAANDTVNNEFYVAPTFSYLAASGAKITTHSVGDVNSGAYGLGTPEDLARFLAERPDLHSVEPSGKASS